MNADAGASIEFRVLGPLEVVLEGELVALGTPKQRALLAVLVISVNQVVSVDRLVDHLWGDEAPARAIASLQAYVSRLRNVIHPSGADHARSEILITRAPGYLLRIDPAAIDAEQFERQAAAGSRLLDAGDAEGAVTVLEGALNRWRGKPYADFGYEGFAQAEIARLDELRLAAADAHVAALLASGRTATAVAEAEALISEHPLREATWGSLITGLYREGRQGEALRAYRRARQVIGDELGLEPSPALKALEAKVLQQSPDLEATSLGKALVPLPELVERPQPPSSSLGAMTDEPVIGRENEVQSLQQTLERATRGDGCAIVLHGEPGIGKTRLAREAARRAVEAGTLLGRGGCVDGPVTAAYWPWTHALRELFHDLDDAVIPLPVRLALSELAGLDPLLAAHAGGITAPAVPADPDLARGRLQRAVVDVVTGLSALRPVVVILEDLQWADASSLQLLSLVAHEVAGCAVLLLITYRDEEVGPTLAASLGTLNRTTGTVDIRLGGLNEHAVHRYATLTAGRELGAAVTASIAARTSGNPLFVGELTRLLESRGSLGAAGVFDAAVPAGVREVIRHRLERLPPQTVTVLKVAAVAGRRFELSLLEHILQLPEDELLEQVESALAMGLVSERAGSGGTFEFTHDLVRDTLQDAVSGARRTRLHARIARALLDHRTEDSARPFEIAHHMVHALPALAVQDVLPHVLAAAGAATAALAFEQAEQQLRSALHLVAQLPEGTGAADELAVRVRLARVLTITRGHATAEAGEHIERAIELAAHVEPRPDVIQALWAAALFAAVVGNLPAAMEVGQNLLSWGRDHDDAAALCLGHTGIGGFSWIHGDLATAARHLAAAVDVVDACSLEHHPSLDPEVASGAWARSRHAQLAWLTGRNDEAEQLTADALQRAERTGKDSALIYAQCYDAWLAIFRRNYQHARHRAHEALTRAETMHYRQHAVLARILIAAASEDPLTRATQLEQSITLWESTGTRLYTPCFLTLQAEAELAVPHTERAAELLQRALGMVSDTGERFYEPEIHRLLAVVARRQGRADQAERHLSRGLEVATNLGLVAFAHRLRASPDV